MFILNNIHDRQYRNVFGYQDRLDKPELRKIIFDLSEKQIRSKRNEDWKELKPDSFAVVVGSSHNISTIYRVSEIRNLGKIEDEESGQQFIVLGEVSAKVSSQKEMTLLLNHYKVTHEKLPNNKFSNGLNVANIKNQLDEIEVDTKFGKMKLSELKLHSALVV